MDIENNSALQLAYFKCYVGDVVPASYMRFVGSKSSQENCARAFVLLSSACSVSGPIMVVLPGQ